MLHLESAKDGILRCGFIDHAGGLKGTPPWPKVHEDGLVLGKNDDCMRSVVADIQALASSKIEELIARIPNEFLAEGAGIIYDELIRRRDVLAVMLDLE